MGDNTTTTQTTPIVQSSTPYAGSIPHIENIMSTGLNDYNAGLGTQLWGGTANAPLDPTLAQGLGQLAAFNAQPGVQQAASLAFDTGRGGLVQTGGAAQFAPSSAIYSDIASTPNSNPFLNQLLNANAARIGNRAASLMSGSGRYGSAGMMDAINRSISETNNPLLYQAAEAARNRQLTAAQGLSQNAQNALTNQRQWASMMPELYSAVWAPMNNLINVGQLYQGRAQQEQNLARQNFEQTQLMPWTQLARYQGAITNLAGIIPRTTTTSGSTTTNTVPTPWTTYAGLGIAGLGALSDERLKTDITPIGVDAESGLMLYAFRYKGDPKHYPKVVGPMAQEVREKYPQLVGEIGGYLYIKG